MAPSEGADSSSIPDGATINLLNSLIESIIGELRSKVDTEVDTNIFLQKLNLLLYMVKETAEYLYQLAARIKNKIESTSGRINLMDLGLEHL